MPALELPPTNPFSEAVRADVRDLAALHGMKRGEDVMRDTGESLSPGEDRLYEFGPSELTYDRGTSYEQTANTLYLSERRTKTVDKPSEVFDLVNGRITASKLAVYSVFRISVLWRYDIAQKPSQRPLHRIIDAEIQGVFPGAPEHNVLMLMSMSGRPDYEQIPKKHETLGTLLRSNPLWSLTQVRAMRREARALARQDELLARAQEKLDIEHLIPIIEAFNGKAKRLKRRRDKVKDVTYGSQN